MQYCYSKLPKKKKKTQTVFYLNKFDSLWLKVDIGEIKVVIMEKILIVRIISRSNVFRQILIFFFLLEPLALPTGHVHLYLFFVFHVYTYLFFSLMFDCCLQHSL